MKSDRNSRSGYLTPQRVLPVVFLVAFAAVYGSRALNYPLGSAFRPGAGLLPIVLVGLLIFMAGMLYLFPARQDLASHPLSKTARPVAGVLGGLLLFGATVEQLGIVVAVCSLVLASAFARALTTVREAVLMAAALSILAVSIFVLALGLPMSIWW